MAISEYSYRSLDNFHEKVLFEGKRRSELVVSRAKTGMPLSRFYDDVWDVSAYNLDNIPMFFDFSYWIESRSPSVDQRRVMDEVKWIVYLMMWVRDGTPINIRTVRHYYHTLSSCARYACSNGISVADIFCDKKCFLEYGRASSSFELKQVLALCSALRAVDESLVGYLVLDSRISNKLKKQIARELNHKDYEQHPPIPLRIYSLVLDNLLAELVVIEGLLDSYIELIREFSVSGEPVAVSKKITSTMVNKSALLFKEKIDGLGLLSYFNDRGLSINRKGAVRGIVDIYAVCKLIVHCFTGMRDEEVNMLESGCLSTFDEFGVSHHVVNGFTMKMSGGKKLECKWLTSNEAVRAIGVLEKISGSIRTAVGAHEATSLFISPRHLYGIGIPTETFFNKTSVHLCRSKRAKELCGFRILEEDIQELSEIDPFRDWTGSERFQVGSVWRVTSHQFRRSLALYASRSGLVTLPSLRRQLQHITEEMSRYYASGYFFAKNILDFDGIKERHFATDYFNAQPESAAISFIKNVLGASETLHGGGGAWVDLNMRGNGSVICLETRKSTMQKFLNGTMSYTDTPMGGCLEKQACQHRSYGRFVYCGTGCGKGIIKLSKVEKVIELQEKLVSSLPDGIARRTEQIILEGYCGVRDNIIAKG